MSRVRARLAKVSALLAVPALLALLVWLQTPGNPFEADHGPIDGNLSHSGQPVGTHQNEWRNRRNPEDETETSAG